MFLLRFKKLEKYKFPRSHAPAWERNSSEAPASIIEAYAEADVTEPICSVSNRSTWLTAHVLLQKLN